MNNTVSTGMAIVIALMSLALGFFIGIMVTGNNLDEEKENMSDAIDSMTDTVSGNESTTNEGATDDSVAFTIDISNLPESQQAMLKTMGIDDTELAITHSMVACAEAKLGVERTNEIQNGATPTVVEGTQLLACYNN